MTLDGGAVIFQVLWALALRATPRFAVGRGQLSTEGQVEALSHLLLPRAAQALDAGHALVAAR